jgi:hypothetical protein
MIVSQFSDFQLTDLLSNEKLNGIDKAELVSAISVCIQKWAFHTFYVPIAEGGNCLHVFEN